MIISLGYIFRNFTVPKDMHLTHITYNITLLYLATIQNSACQLMCPSARRESVFSSVFAQDTDTMPLWLLVPWFHYHMHKHTQAYLDICVCLIVYLIIPTEYIYLMNVSACYIEWACRHIILMCLLLNIIILTSQVPVRTSPTASVRCCPTKPHSHLSSRLSKTCKWRSSSSSSCTSIASAAINISCFLAVASPSLSASVMVTTGILESKSCCDKSQL